MCQFPHIICKSGSDSWNFVFLSFNTNALEEGKKKKKVWYVDKDSSHKYLIIALQIVAFQNHRKTVTKPH